MGKKLPALGEIQRLLINRRSGPAYTVDTPLVYNAALDDVGPGAHIKLILVADNPGRREQAAENRRYLVGPSGKIAEKFFLNNPGLDIVFRSNVIILNKTPIHTPRTAELSELVRLGGDVLAGALRESQITMARLIAEFHQALAPIPVWIIGYSEMKRRGVFEAFTETLRELYRPQTKRRWEIFLYRHFSMNQFTIDLRRQTGAEETTADTLQRIGAAYRERILGW